MLFIAVLYTTAPAVAVFAQTNLLQKIPGASCAEVPEWFKNWEKTDLISWIDKNADGTEARGANKERLWNNEATASSNELYIDRDIMVLANPEIAKLPNWVVALVAAGGLAAAYASSRPSLIAVSSLTPRPTVDVQDLIDRACFPRASVGRDHSEPMPEH